MAHATRPLSKTPSTDSSTHIVSSGMTAHRRSSSATNALKVTLNEAHSPPPVRMDRKPSATSSSIVVGAELSTRRGGVENGSSVRKRDDAELVQSGDPARKKVRTSSRRTSEVANRSGRELGMDTEDQGRTRRRSSGGSQSDGDEMRHDDGHTLLKRKRDSSLPPAKQIATTTTSSSSSESSPKRARTHLSPFDSLAQLATTALSSLPEPVSPMLQARPVTSGRSPLVSPPNHEVEEQAQQVKSATTMRAQQLQEIERRRTLPSLMNVSSGLSTALGKIRGSDRELEHDGSGLGSRRRGAKLLTVSTNANNGRNIPPLRSAPILPHNTGLLGPSISRNGLATAYPSYGPSSPLVNIAVGQRIPSKGEPPLSSRPRGSTSINLGTSSTGGSTKKAGPIVVLPPHRDSYHPPGNSRAYQSIPSQLLHQQQSHGNQPLATYPQSAGLKSTSTSASSSSQYLHPSHSQHSQRYSPPNSNLHSPPTPHYQHPPHSSGGSYLQAPPSPSMSSSKSTFLNLFSTFYDSLSDSRVLTNTLEDQLRRSATLLATLQDSGKVFENMLDDRLRTVVRDLSNDLLLCERRIERLERANDAPDSPKSSNGKTTTMTTTSASHLSEPAANEIVAGDSSINESLAVRLQRLEKKLALSEGELYLDGRQYKEV